MSDTEEQDGLGTKLPKGFTLKVNGKCTESGYHTKRFGYTVRCPIEQTTEVRTGTATRVKFLNEDNQKWFISNGIHHWAWKGDNMYCFPEVKAEEVSEIFPKGSTMTIELLDGGDDLDDSSEEEEEEEPEDPSKVVPDTDGKLHVFMVGNSYTRQNNLCRITQGVFQAAQPDTAKIDGHCPPGQTWGGHLAGMLGETTQKGGARIQRALTTQKNRQWNWVILQNQSQLPAYIQDNPGAFNNTVEECKRMYKHIQEHNPGVKIMFYMTWGRCKRNTDPNPAMFTDYLTNQAKLTAGYLKYQEETTTDEWPTYIAPVGLVHQTIYQDCVDQGIEDPTADGSLFRKLYWRDRHHPSALGSYVAAMTIYASLTGNLDLVDWVPDWDIKGEEPVDPEIAKTLREAVVRTIEETKKTGLITYPWQ